MLPHTGVTQGPLKNTNGSRPGYFDLIGMECDLNIGIFHYPPGCFEVHRGLGFTWYDHSHLTHLPGVPLPHSPRSILNTANTDTLNYKSHHIST